ncbi:ATP-binding protein [Paenibacillus lutrae]|uniref:histidine kinase n=1 Tax=Paenibacillus lutrae TaxID=2078573 RepID=A0A7X3FI79_9BACL|nr:HAMP domain-containing protein [Paenibacillus lutrae]
MFSLRSVVGKLWLTIIGLVAVILMILGLFLVQSLEQYFSQSEDQIKNLEKLATDYSSGASSHPLRDDEYYQMANELLELQDARMIALDKSLTELNSTATGNNEELLRFHAVDFFSEQELASVLSGSTVEKQIPYNAKKTNTRNDYIAVAVPTYANPDNGSNEIQGAIIIYQSLKSLESTQWDVFKLFVIVSIIGFLMTTVFAFFLFYRITRPLLQLKEAAGRISKGEYGTKVPILSSDEIGELAKSFNVMGEDLQESVRALRREKENLASVLRSMTDAVMTFDSEGSVTLTNPQGDKIIQEWNKITWNPDIQPEEGEETSRIPVDRSIPAPLQVMFRDVVKEAREQTDKLHVENEVWSVAMTPLHSREGVRGAVAVLRDVTEEFRLDKLRKDFVANVSHELRTPLSMVQGYSEALIDDIAGSPEERQELAQVIYDEALRMGRLVRDLLDLARMEAGHLEMNFNRTDVGGLLKRMHRKFSVLAREKDIRLSFELRQEDLLCMADEDRLEQVLTNLLDNAFRHTPGGRRITIKAESCSYKSGPGCQIEVIDEGQGIPAEDVPYVFERFYKADKARTRGATGGTGLGLAIVKNIVDAHQGTITMRSKLGQGTTFTIVLPCRSCELA